MKRATITIFLIGILTIINAQDTLVMTSGEHHSVIVKKVGINTIEYVRFDNPSGALYEVLKTDVSKIIYQNGVEDIIQRPLNSQKPVEETKKTTGEFIDVRDCTSYKYVLIGSQMWMTENLKYKYGESRCDHLENGECDECGSYYTFDEAILACPAGWHLPTDNEWMDLEMLAGMWETEAVQLGWRGNSPGQAPAFMKYGTLGLDLSLCGFLEKELGMKQYYEIEINTGAYYWTGTEATNASAIYRHLMDRKSIQRDNMSKKNRIPIRCVKD
jgi:uncharacterized protein (TIGR02145 family)